MNLPAYFVTTTNVKSIYTQQTLRSFRALYEVSEEAIINYGFSANKEGFKEATDTVIENFAHQAIMDAATEYDERVYAEECGQEGDKMALMYDYWQPPFFQPQYNGKLIPEDSKPFHYGGVKVWKL